MEKLNIMNRSILTEILSYNPENFPFDQIIRKLLEKESLDALSIKDEQVETKKEYSFYKNMEQSSTFKKLYQNLEGTFGEEFYRTYYRFIKEVIRPQFSEAIYFQKKPSHRILFRDLEGVARFHKDSDYGHNPTEINYWVPQTMSFKSNSIWIANNAETREPEEHSPVQLEVGEYLKFDGANLSHGAMPNKTGKSRVSFDFRVVPVSEASSQIKEVASNQNGQNPVMTNAHKFELCE